MTPEIEKIFLAEKEKEDRCRKLFGDIMVTNENRIVSKIELKLISFHLP